MTDSLAGCRVAVTRPRHQNRRFSEMLEAAGAEVTEHPLLVIAPLIDPTGLAARLVGVTDVIVTSANAAAVLTPSDARIWAMGPATAAGLTAPGATVEAGAPGEDGAALADRVIAAGITGRRFALVQAETARGVVEERLRQAGADVVAITAYRTTPDDGAARDLAAAMTGGEVDVVTFLSGSATDALGIALGTWPQGVAAACMGATAADAVARRNWTPRVEARPATPAGLVATLGDWWAAAR